MEYVFLGKSDLQISRIGFGGMSLDADDSESIKILHKALDGGINFFDTADLYQQGGNESLFGTAFKGKRHQIVLTSKVGNQWKADGSGWDWNPRPEYIVQALERSLQRLQTDYLDLYMLHGGTLEDPIDDIIETFEKLKSSGKIRHYGISSIRPNVIREWTSRSSLVSVMLQYSLLDRRPEEEVLPLLQKKGIGVLVRGVLAKGLLASKPAVPFLNYSAVEVEKMQAALNTISVPQQPAFAIAVQFALNAPAVTSVVIGIRTENQLQDAIIAGNAFALSSEQRNMLIRILSKNNYSEHR